MPEVAPASSPSAQITSGAVINAQIRTLDRDRPTAEAVSWRDGMILAVGSTADVLGSSGDLDEVIDLRGGTLTPGLIDSHIHPILGSQATRGADMSGRTTIEAVRAGLAKEAAQTPDGQWVRAWNLDYRAFADCGVTADAIESAVAGRPFLGIFYDLHTALASHAAIDASGIADAPPIRDSLAEIVRDSAGRPTGELREADSYLAIFQSQAPTDPAEILATFAEVTARFNAVGVTGGVVMDADAETLDLLAAAEANDVLSMRIIAALWHHPEYGEERIVEIVQQTQRRGRRWESGAVKIYADGVIDTGTAWLREPDSCGCGARPFWPSPDHLRELIGRYAAAGIALSIHATGDRATDFVLDAYSSAALPANGARHRLEHLELLGDVEVAKLAEVGAIASMQPLHMQWRQADASDSFSKRLGPARTGHAFRVRDVIDAGVTVCLGSDWPVASLDPRVGMAWARLRRRPGEPDAPVFEPDQRLDGLQALYGYTRWAAAAVGHPEWGVIAPGTPADLAGFAGDPVQTPADDLVDLPVVLTVVDGQIVHRGQS